MALLGVVRVRHPSVPTAACCPPGCHTPLENRRGNQASADILVAQALLDGTDVMSTLQRMGGTIRPQADLTEPQCTVRGMATARWRRCPVCRGLPRSPLDPVLGAVMPTQPSWFAPATPSPKGSGAPIAGLADPAVGLMGGTEGLG